MFDEDHQFGHPHTDYVHLGSFAAEYYGNLFELEIFFHAALQKIELVDEYL